MPAAAPATPAARAAAQPASVPAQWFDGRSSRAQPVTLWLLPAARGPDLALQAPGLPPLRLRHADIGWPESWASPARAGLHAVTLDLRDHGSVQVSHLAAWHAALATAGARPSLAERMQTRWHTLLAVALLGAALLGAFHRWGTPWLATQLAALVPLAWEQQLANQTLQALDRGWLKPSKLPAARQADLRQRFAAIAHLASQAQDLPGYPGYHPPLRLELRSGMPANAFALPGGTIIMTDALVRQASRTPGTGDAALLGVLAHEIGHVQHRHATRTVVEQGVLNIGLSLALGDVSTLMSSGASLVTGLSYSRNHEQQADCYAIALMGKARLPTTPMADLLLDIDRQQAHDSDDGEDSGDDGSRRTKAKAQAGKADSPDKGAPQPAGKTSQTPPTTRAGASAPPAAQDAAGPAPWGDWLSTHPDTQARALRLKSAHPQGC